MTCALQNHIQKKFKIKSMIAAEHPVSELISMYKKLACINEAGANKKSAQISNFVTQKNLEKSLKTLNLKNVLVWGSQTETWAIFLAKLGFEVTVIDEDIDILKRLEQTACDEDISINLLQSKPEKLTIPDSSFDLVLAENANISFASDPLTLLEEFKWITKTDGYIWINYLNLSGWTLMQRDIEMRMQLTRKEEEIIYLGKNEKPVTLFSPKKIRYMLYDAGFLELNEFGNGILTSPLLDDDKIPDFDLQEIKLTELQLSRNYNLIGSAFHIQVLAQKIIY